MTDMTDMWPLLDRQGPGFRLIHQWPVPSGIKCDETGLRYGGFSSRSDKIKRRPGPALLDGFVTLNDAPPSEIEKYAKIWGVLGLCQHGLVWGHEELPDQTDDCRLVNPEPIERWHHFAGEFRSLLDEATELRLRGRLQLRSAKAEKQVWDFLVGVDTAVRNFGSLRPILVVLDGRFELLLTGRRYETGLSAALTTQLIFTLAGASGIATCASCGSLFLPRRRPRPRQNSYCQNCGIRGAWRAAQQRRREKLGDRGLIYKRRSLRRPQDGDRERSEPGRGNLK